MPSSKRHVWRFAEGSKNGFFHSSCNSSGSMAYLYRLGAAVLLVLTLAMVWTPARASFPATAGFTYTAASIAGEATSSDTSATGACVKKPPLYNDLNGSNEMRNPRATEEVCTVDFYERSSGAFNFTNGGQITKVATNFCPVGATLSGSSCTCTPPKVQNAAGTGCEEANLCSGFNGLPTPFTVSEARTSNMTTAGMSAAIGQTRNHCVSGCVAAGTVQAAFRANTGEVTLIIAGSKFNGSSCDIAAAPGSGEGGTSVAQAEPTLCSKSGKCPGQINGVDVCVPCAASGTSSSLNTVKLDTASPPAGAASGTPGTSGTTTESTSSKTVCEGSNCTTTSSSTKSNPDGTTSTQVVTAEKPKADFCKENPRDKSCLDGGGSFGGSCGAFTCEGDALQCAMAREQHARNCTVFDTPTAESAIYDAQKGKEGVQYTSSSVAITSGSFDQSNAIGVAASCVADKTISINVSGRSFSATLPLSGVCPYLGWLGYFNLAVAFVLAARIVGRG